MKRPNWFKLVTLFKVAKGLLYALPKFDYRRKKQPPTKADIKAEADAARAKIRQSN